MPRYARECRITLQGDKAIAQKHIARARKLLGTLKDISGPGVTTNSIQREIAPGVTAKAEFVDGQPALTIAAKPPTENLAGKVKTEGGWWSPEGFVFYPASDESPHGWGFPILDKSTGGPLQNPEDFLKAENLRPGLDTKRWTPAGALGQVLLTKKPDAGYPPLPTDDTVVVVVPGLYHPEHGPHPESAPPPAPPSAEWKAYRMEMVGYDANAETASTDERREIRDWKREQFLLHNTHRESLGLPVFYPAPRGYYDSAQATSEWNVKTGWWGHNCAGFPDTWKTASGRIEKNNSADGLHPLANPASMRVSGYNPGAENIAARHATGFTTEYIDHTGFPVYSGVDFSPQTAQQAFDTWLNSPPHRAIIERAATGQGVSYSMHYFFGYRGGSGTMHYLQKYQWISCGNRYWHSKHPEIPTLSWYGPGSKNLNGEFWRVRFELGLVSAHPLTTQLRAAYHEPVLDDTINDPEAWYCRLPYRHGKRADGHNREQAILGPCIFARGRVIAIAPDRGFVLAAAMHKPPALSAPCRLLALCIHPGDQPNDPWQGFTPIVRLWWCDLPADVVAGNPHATIRTKYGEEEHNWPYVDQNSPYSWRGGDPIRVDSSGLNRPAGDLLSYASLWEFNDTATKAVCLRYSYNRDLFGPRTAETYGWGGELLNQGDQAMYMYMSGVATTAHTGGFFSGVASVTGTPTFCELSLRHYDAAVGVTSRFWLHNPRNEYLPTNPDVARVREDHWYIAESFSSALSRHTWWDAPYRGQLWRLITRVIPTYAYYVGDEVRAVYDVEANKTRAPKEHYSSSKGYFSQTRYFVQGNSGVFYRGVATGPSVVGEAECEALCANATLYSSEIGARGVDVMSDSPIVLHADKDHVVFAAAGVDCPIIAEEGDLPDGYPFNLDGDANATPALGFSVSSNPRWNRGDVVETQRDVIQFDLYINGDRVRSARFVNPEAKYVHKSWLRLWEGADIRNVPPSSTVIPYLHRCWNTCWAFTGGFAKNRAGEWAAAINFGLQWGVLSPTNYIYTFTDSRGQAQKVFTPNAGHNYTTLGDHPNVGGFMLSSFASERELAQMMNITGENPRSIYVRLV